MVKLTRIYTRTGDAGFTRLSDNSKTAKTDPHLEAEGSVDEANSVLGVVLAQPELDKSIREVLSLIQNELFDVGADLSTPLAENPKWAPLRIEQDSIDRLESWCDSFGASLPKLNSFILPGGTLAGAYLHVARTVVRRAERHCWHCVADYGTEVPGGINLLAVKYLNRLSDLLFILARVANVGSSAEVLWVQGSGRENPNLES